jgi:hypothetical protein
MSKSPFILGAEMQKSPLILGAGTQKSPDSVEGIMERNAGFASTFIFGRLKHFY